MACIAVEGGWVHEEAIDAAACVQGCDDRVWFARDTGVLVLLSNTQLARPVAVRDRLAVSVVQIDHVSAVASTCSILLSARELSASQAVVRCCCVACSTGEETGSA